MDRIWQWAWDRHGPRYSWAVCVVLFPVWLPIYLLPSLIVVAVEESGRYVDAAGATRPRGDTGIGDALPRARPSFAA